jgi:hypothetical protein
MHAATSGTTPNPTPDLSWSKSEQGQHQKWDPLPLHCFADSDTGASFAVPSKLTSVHNPNLYTALKAMQGIKGSIVTGASDGERIIRHRICHSARKHSWDRVLVTGAAAPDFKQSSDGDVSCTLPDDWQGI